MSVMTMNESVFVYALMTALPAVAYFGWKAIRRRQRNAVKLEAYFRHHEGRITDDVYLRVLRMYREP